MSQPHETQWFATPAFGDAPVGAVIAFAGPLGPPQPATASPPSTFQTAPPTTDSIEAWGWMFCDGRTLSIYQYPELFAALGYLYGGSDKSFRIPDYRGYFLRCTDAGAGVDPDAGSRSPPAGGSTPQDVGSQQTFALQSHAHEYSGATSNAQPSNSGSAAGFPTIKTLITENGPVDTSPPGSKVEVSEYETRPKNIYVNHLIKFTYALKPSMQ